MPPHQVVVTHQSARTLHVVEHQVPYSTALHAQFDGRLFLVGPLTRYSRNSDRLSPVAAQAATAAGLGARCLTPFRSIVIRAVEVVYAVRPIRDDIDRRVRGLLAEILDPRT